MRASAVLGYGIRLCGTDVPFEMYQKMTGPRDCDIYPHGSPNADNHHEGEFHQYLLLTKTVQRVDEDDKPIEFLKLPTPDEYDDKIRAWLEANGYLFGVEPGRADNAMWLVFPQLDE